MSMNTKVIPRILKNKGYTKKQRLYTKVKNKSFTKLVHTYKFGQYLMVLIGYTRSHAHISDICTQTHYFLQL